MKDLDRMMNSAHHCPIDIAARSAREPKYPEGVRMSKSSFGASSILAEVVENLLCEADLESSWRFWYLMGGGIRIEERYSEGM
jgi:hypothetical protein